MSKRRIMNITVNDINDGPVVLPSYIKLRKRDSHVNGNFNGGSLATMPKEPMLAHPIMSFSKLDSLLSSLGYEHFVMETKFDGERVLCSIDERESVFYTRTLKRMNNLQFSVILQNAKSAILDGERVYVNPHETAVDAAIDSLKIVPICDTGVRSVLRQMYIVFDIQAYDGKFIIYQSYEERRRVLERVIVETENVRLVKPKAIDTLATLRQTYDAVLSNDGEGLIVKDTRVPYTPGRRNDWIKLKPLHLIEHRQEYDLYAFRALRDKNGIYTVLECGYYENSNNNDDDNGNGNNQEDCNNVTDTGKFVSVCKVSSGLNDVTKNRLKLLINHRDGTFKRPTIVTITADKITNRRSLRHPSFLKFSFEKDTVNTALFRNPS